MPPASQTGAFRLINEAGDEAIRLGYFCVEEDRDGGFVGALLVVTPDARPVEFHCAEPVRPNRVQQILYGPTLRAHVVGDRIGGALLEGLSRPIDLLVATGVDEASAAERIGVPSVVASDGAAAATLDDRLAAAVRRLAETTDLAEPFERVRAAIREAHGATPIGDADAAAA